MAPVVGLQERPHQVPCVQIVEPRNVGLRQYRDHLVVDGAGKHLCLVCGRVAAVRTRLTRFPCPGEGHLTAPWKAALLVGVFDAAILRGGPRAISVAERLGRRPRPAPD